MSEAIITTGTEVQHTKHDHQYGFDLTDFGNKESFHAFLDGLDMPGETYIGRVETDLGLGRYVWADERGMVVTGNNPTSGKHANDERPPEKGYASYIGIEGTEEFVATARVGVEFYADYIKGRSGRRDYI